MSIFYQFIINDVIINENYINYRSLYYYKIYNIIEKKIISKNNKQLTYIKDSNNNNIVYSKYISIDSIIKETYEKSGLILQIKDNLTYHYFYGETHKKYKIETIIIRDNKKSKYKKIIVIELPILCPIMKEIFDYNTYYKKTKISNILLFKNINIQFYNKKFAYYDDYIISKYDYDVSLINIKFCYITTFNMYLLYKNKHYIDFKCNQIDIYFGENVIDLSLPTYNLIKMFNKYLNIHIINDIEKQYKIHKNNKNKIIIENINLDTKEYYSYKGILELFKQNKLTLYLKYNENFININSKFCIYYIFGNKENLQYFKEFLFKNFDIPIIPFNYNIKNIINN